MYKNWIITYIVYNELKQKTIRTSIIDLHRELQDSNIQDNQVIKIELEPEIESNEN